VSTANIFSATVAGRVQCDGCENFFCGGDAKECKLDDCDNCVEAEGESDEIIAACWRCRHNVLVDCDVCSRALCSEHRGEDFETRPHSLHLAPGIDCDESRCGECLGAWRAPGVRAAPLHAAAAAPDEPM
jgi:hypothetical protein